jgi:hypothetical protein
VARAGDIRVSIGDPRAAVAALGIRVETAIEDGLRATVASIAAAGG